MPQKFSKNNTMIGEERAQMMAPSSPQYMQTTGTSYQDVE
jgi:hypothetical protein